MEPFSSFPGGGNYPRKSHNAAPLRRGSGRRVGIASIDSTKDDRRQPVKPPIDMHCTHCTWWRLPHHPPSRAGIITLTLFPFWHGMACGRRRTGQKQITPPPNPALPGPQSPLILSMQVRRGAGPPDSLGSMSSPRPGWQVFLFECCHSGTGLKSPVGNRPFTC